ncbi:MAG TPA: hypothetical protein VHB79_36000 [Polyangiaceae bacterium]|nr:hypothetical protein [Polyangiaceae bacterium]
MTRSPALAAAAAVAIAAASCERNVAVGHEDAPVTVGAQPPVGEAGAGGVEPEGDAGEGGQGGARLVGDAGMAGEGTSPSWSADHETGTLDQWLGDGAGLRYLEGSGTLAISSEHAHSGQYAFVASITADDGAQHQAVLGRDLIQSEGRYGAWYYLPVAPRADYWVIMKLSNGPLVDRFDIDIEVPAGGQPHLRLYEHDDGWISEPSSLVFPTRQWVHVEALYRSTAQDNGRLVVLQDGQQVLDSGPRPTASDAHVTFFCGSSSRYVSPAPYRLFIDDASVREDRVP